MMRRILRSACASICAAAIAMAWPVPVMAQQVGAALPPAGASPARAESVTVAAGARYQAGALHRWFGGSTYRDLWTMPMRVPVLDWHTYAGGLHPTKVGGGMQTKSLRFEKAGGSEYVFRLSDKATNSAPPLLRNTPVVRLFQDEVSALHPAAAQLSAPIIEASGVLHPTAVLVVMADDSTLGEFDAVFAGQLGMIEEYPNVPKDGPGFGGATKIIDSPELLHLLDSDARQHIDAPAFLTARLTDFLINDNDRHAGNWKWARLPSGSRTQWEPIARDRDHAFISYNGVLMRLALLVSPTFVSFGDEPSVAGLTWPRGFDARLLAGLERPVWDSVARALQTRITDPVIDAAVHALPVEYSASAPVMAEALRRRRAALPDAAGEYYRMLAARVVVHGTDAADRVVVTRARDRFVDVRVESGGEPFFSRRFDARETSEIVVYLHDGDDTALVTGRAHESITVRIVGGNGTNTFIDSSTVSGHGHPTHFYDAGTVGGVSYGLDTLFERRPWERKNGELAPPGPDNGAGYAPLAGITLNRRTGITPRIGVVRYGYGFAHRPYAWMAAAQGEYAMGFQGVRVGLSADRRLESSPLHFTALARMSDLEVVNFSGFGNATIDSGGANTYFEVRQREWLLHPALALAVGSRMDLSLGPVVRHTETDSARSRYLSATRPYGFGTFDQVGLQLGARYEWRSLHVDEEHTHHRVLVELTGRWVPAVMSVRAPFGAAGLTLGTSMTLPIPAHPFLVMRAGGTKLYGNFPFQDAATIGGEGTTRYMDTQRYAGDASLYGTSEVRIPVARFHLLIPVRVGILGLAESGRVYDGGRSPGGWHARTGEGIWFGRGDASSVITLTRTTEPGHAGIHLRLGLNF
jgi:hypothetical protein